MFLEELLRGGDWQVTDRIVEVDSVDRVLLRRAASDEEIAEVFEGATGLLLNPAIEEEGRVGPYEPQPLRDLVQPEGGEASTRLGSSAIPVLLGAAIIGTVRPGITYQAQTVYIAQRRRRAAKRGTTS